jgi:cell wall-associated NlpC family hydrolase
MMGSVRSPSATPGTDSALPASLAVMGGREPADAPGDRPYTQRRYSTMSPFRQHRPLTTGRLAILLTVGPLTGCARASIELALSPSHAPSLRTTIAPLTVGQVMRGRGRMVSASAARVLATADRYVGTRYRYGGESPGEGFDCSGLVQFVYGRHGVELPRSSYQQARAGRPAPREITALQPGDLMFFSAGGRRVDHVAIYAGGGRIIHATSGAGTVRYDDFDTKRGKWLLQRFVTSRRVLPEARQT